MLKYYQILGLTEKASVLEIKKAYRKLAMLYHPDRNKTPEATGKFLEITEAYDMLLAYKEKGPIIVTRRQTKQHVTKEDLIRKKREAARKAAQRYAQMRYEEFVKSDYYKNVVAMDVVLAHVAFYGSLFIIAGLPLILLWWKGAGGLVVGGIIVFITLPMWIVGLRQWKEMDSSMLLSSVRRVSGIKKVQTLVISLLNLFLFIKIGFQTMVPLIVLIVTYSLLMVVAFIWMRYSSWKKPDMSRTFVVGCLAPLFVNLLLTLNYLISFNPAHEIYSFNRTYQRTKYGYQASTLIRLPENQYEWYPGIRTFLNEETLNGYSSIDYTFERGILGIRVMKDYTLH